VPDAGDMRILAHLLGERIPQHWDAALEASWLARIVDEGQDFVFHEIERPLVPVVRAMMQNGIRVDVPWLEAAVEDFRLELETCQGQIDRLAGRRLAVGNHDELANYLYQALGLPIRRLTPAGHPAVDAAALRELADFHKIVGLILKYRLHKLLLDNMESYLARVDRATCRIHCELDPLGAATGRLSCKNPALQAVPALLLEMFVAEPGHLLIELDFSQIELRVLAYLSQDPGLLDAYSGDEVDLHRRAAAWALVIPEEHVTQAQRDTIGKVLNFSIIYGMTPLGLADKLGVPVEEAQRLLARYWKDYPEVPRWAEGVRRAAWRDGFVTTLYGRRRRLPGLRSDEQQAHAMREAVNTKIQGTAADINKLALIRLHRALPPDCRLLLTVHDSVLVEAPEPRAAEVAAHLQKVMEEPPPGFDVPIKVKARWGATWKECKS
jgi:DNA polymerase-1